MPECVLKELKNVRKTPVTPKKHGESFWRKIRRPMNNTLKTSAHGRMCLWTITEAKKPLKTRCYTSCFQPFALKFLKLNQKIRRPFGRGFFFCTLGITHP